MLKPSDINYLDDEVIKAYAASAGTFRKRFALDSSSQFSRIFRGLVCTRL